jgi:hypothetical protein
MMMNLLATGFMLSYYLRSGGLKQVLQTHSRLRFSPDWDLKFNKSPNNKIPEQTLIVAIYLKYQLITNIIHSIYLNSTSIATG